MEQLEPFVLRVVTETFSVYRRPVASEITVLLPLGAQFSIYPAEPMNGFLRLVKRNHVNQWALEIHQQHRFERARMEP